MQPEQRDYWQEVYEERAAIMQYEAEMSVEEAEREAYARTVELMRRKGITDGSEQRSFGW